MADYSVEIDGQQVQLSLPAINLSCKSIYKKYLDQYELKGQRPNKDTFYDFYKIKRQISTLSFVNNENTKEYEKILLSDDNTGKEYLPFYNEIIIKTNNNEYDESFLQKIKDFNLLLPFFEELQKNVDLSNPISIEDFIDSIDSDPQSIGETFIDSSDPQSIRENFNFIDGDPINGIVGLQRYFTAASTNTEHTTDPQFIGYVIIRTDETRNEPKIILVSNNKNNLAIIDSQIEYGKKYTYTVRPIVIFYSDNQFYIHILANSSNNSINPLASTTLLSIPPPQPQVSLYPVANSTKVKILFSNQVNSIQQIKRIGFVDIGSLSGQLPKNEAEHEKIWKNYGDSDVLDIFGIPPTEYIYYCIRIESEPYSYLDFTDASNKILLLKTQQYPYLEDNLSLNKKYYYIFLASDSHYHISSPSKVYTVQLNNDNGTIFPIFGIHNFRENESDIKQSDISFNKLLYFSPAARHLQYNDQQEEAVNNRILRNISVGSAIPSIWNKKFKFRLTSIKTGKKIDINTHFIKKDE